MLAEMDRLQWAPPDAVAAGQLDRLNALLEHARRAPATAQRLRAAGLERGAVPSLEALERLAPIRRTDLQRNREAMVPSGTPRETLHRNATGGSTGEPVTFYQDVRYHDHGTAAEMLVQAWWNVGPGDRTAALWGADREFTEMSAKERFAQRLHRFRALNAFRLTEARMAEFADMLVRWRPEYVVGYAGVLDLFAGFLIARGISGIRPRSVRSSAEVLHPAARERIGRAFGAPVHDFYGCREINNLAAECPALSGLHVLGYGRIVEVLDAEGRRVASGGTGEVVVTDLVNRGMPLLRYATGDLAVLADGSCSCGRSFPRLARVVGRESDFIVTPDGRTLHGEVFSHLFYDLAGVRRFQVVQERTEAIEILVERDPEGPPPDLAAIESGAARLLGPSVAARVRVVEAIPPAPSGKHKFVVSRARAVRA
jgi:phenylacetate-CoA ligase